MVNEVNENTILQALKENHICCVKLGAEWCAPCKSIAPDYAKLAGEVDADVAMYSMSVDDNPDFSSNFNIRSIPTILVFVDGNVEKKFVGNDSVNMTRDYIAQISH